jgi:hypothetical protein
MLHERLSARYVNNAMFPFPAPAEAIPPVGLPH